MSQKGFKIKTIFPSFSCVCLSILWQQFSEKLQVTVSIISHLLSRQMSFDLSRVFAKGLFLLLLFRLLFLHEVSHFESQRWGKLANNLWDECFRFTFLMWQCFSNSKSIYIIHIACVLSTLFRNCFISFIWNFHWIVTDKNDEFLTQYCFLISYFCFAWNINEILSAYGDEMGLNIRVLRLSWRWEKVERIMAHKHSGWRSFCCFRFVFSNKIGIL